jgi:RNA-directed DNA polymerase
MAKRKNARKARKPKEVQKDFEKVLALPERLAQYLRLWFHLSKAQWDFALDKARRGRAYKEWSRSKGRGKGRRYFAAPCLELKEVQKAILDRFLSQVTVHFCRYGGQKGSSIVKHVDFHSGAKSVFAVDIVNAFPSVFRSRVQAVLRKPFDFHLRQFEGVEFTEEDRNLMLAAVVDLVVWKDRIPQGPPTSPRLFDIVCGKMDQQLYDLVQKNSTPFQSYRLSIWTDNITLSSDGEIPEELREAIVKVIRDSRFIVHSREDKMKYFSPETGEVPIITGLVLLEGGRKTIAPRKVNQLRARLTNLLRRKAWDSEVRGTAAGVLGFIRQVYPNVETKLPAKLRQLVPQAEVRLKERQEPDETPASS